MLDIYVLCALCDDLLSRYSISFDPCVFCDNPLGLSDHAKSGERGSF